MDPNTPVTLLLVAMLAACSNSTGTDTAKPAADALSFDIEGAWEGTGLSLTAVEPGVDVDDVDSGIVFFEGAVTGATVGIDPGEVPAEHLIEDEELTLALYLPALFDDANANGTHDEGEVMLGLSRHWPLWIEGDPPTEYADLGLVAGWNAIELEVDEENDFAGDFTVRDPLAIPLADSLRSVEEMTLGGTYAGTQPMADQRLTLAPHAVVFTGDDVVHAEPLYDEPLSDPWTITVSGEPPQSHQFDVDGLMRAVDYPVTYVDADGSGGPSAGEALVNMACVGTGFVSVSWDAPPTTVAMAANYEYLFSRIGVLPGWSASVTDTDPVETRGLEAAELTGLELTSACVP
jgi:hypothetical protein